MPRPSDGLFRSMLAVGATSEVARRRVSGGFQYPREGVPAPGEPKLAPTAIPSVKGIATGWAVCAPAP